MLCYKNRYNINFILFAFTIVLINNAIATIIDITLMITKRIEVTVDRAYAYFHNTYFPFYYFKRICK
jgi:hypothetical protein